MTPAATATRAERRRRATETRLLEAALRVFSARGYDAATTGEVARAADVAAGTFYLHFRDKRAAYERLAYEASRELLSRWSAAMRPGMPLGERVALGLRLAADYWQADVARARLLLEGGPSFGSEAHLRLVDEVAALLAASAPRPRPAHARSLALLAVGLAVEAGRVIVARPAPAPEVEQLIALVRRAVAATGVRAASRGRSR